MESASPRDKLPLLSELETIFPPRPRRRERRTMMRSNLRFGFALLLASGLVSGCGTKSPLNNQATSGSSGSSSDRAEVSRQLADNPDFVDNGVFESSDPTATGDAQAGTLESSSPGPAATLQRLRFWRRIAHVSRTFEFSFGDTDSTGRP